jgi:hypothetical protein
MLRLAAVVGTSLAVWLWRPWEGAWNQGDLEVTIVEPDPATACTVACINETDKPIVALIFTYSDNVQ